MEGVDQDPTIVVLEPAALGLVDHLSKKGLPIHPGDVKSKIHRGIAQHWGTANTKRFQDANGGGWVLDLSDYFNDEMLYAVIRSGPGGNRCVVAIVEGDEVEALQKGKSLPGLEDGTDIPEPAIPAHVPGQAPARARPPAPAPAREEPSAPVLVLVMTDGLDLPENIIRTTAGSARDEVGALLRSGIKPESIEIWSGVRKPKVQIAFE